MKTLLDLFTGDTLKPYLDKANHLNRLNSIWQSAVDSDWFDQCKVGNYENGQLTLTTTHSSWATRIRYATPEITKKLKQYDEFKNLEKIKCKVILTSTTPTSENQQKISDYGQEVLRQASINIADLELKNTLAKLCRKD